MKHSISPSCIQAFESPLKWLRFSFLHQLTLPMLRKEADASWQILSNIANARYQMSTLLTLIATLEVILTFYL